MTNNRQVSFHDEALILVDSNDSAIGHATKEHCHRREGLLHRAFSIFVFNSKNELLMQKRAANKYHSSNLWTNTTCSHPRPNENNLSNQTTGIYKIYPVPPDLPDIQSIFELNHIEGGSIGKQKTRKQQRSPFR